MDLMYIKMLAQNTGTDISGWDLKKIFGNTKDRCLINKKFFARTQNVTTKKKPVKKISVPATSKKLLDKKKMMIKLESIIRSSKDKSWVLSNKMESTKKLNKLKGGSGECLVENQIKYILRDNFWENPIFKGKYLYFNTKNDVIVRRTTKGENPENFGKFAVSIDLETFGVRLLPFENNLCADGYCIHPFMVGDHDICFGNSYNAANNLKMSMDLPGYMSLLSSLLTTYDDEGSSPNYPIEDFFDSFDMEDYMESYRYNSNHDAHIHPLMLKKYPDPDADD